MKCDGHVYTFRTSGVCAKSIDVMILPRNVVGKVAFNGGCPGHRRAVASLVSGMRADKVVKCLRGIECGQRGTSCADQLARCLEHILDARKNERKARRSG